MGTGGDSPSVLTLTMLVVVDGTSGKAELLYERSSSEIGRVKQRNLKGKEST